ncbi:MAG: 2-dehydropantoate 2-reductase, partial [Candidatus Marinimicrobia bacterium]|nr:2-dehydropantoate 2-reductase [Candidatus Neomarinimicrobiota bacterium]
RNGLSVQSRKENFTIKVNVSDNPNDFESKPDLILLTVKYFDTDSAIEQLKPVVFRKTQILSLQNGLENYPKLVNAFGEEQVVRGFCGMNAEVLRPGFIQGGQGYIFIGENIGEISARTQWLKSLFETSNIQCTVSQDIHQDVWRKFAWNCIFNIVSATTQLTVGKIVDDPEKIQFCKELFKEIQQVAKSQDVVLGADKEKLIFDIAGDSGDIKPSTLQDRLKGKRMEYDAFTGALIRLADKHKIPIPINRSLYDQLEQLGNP